MTATGAVRPATRRTLSPGDSSRRAGLAGLGLLLFVCFSVGYENYFSAANTVTTALNVSSIAIASIGSMALLTSGNVDLSIGSQFALVSVVCATVVRDSGSPVLGVMVALLLGLLLGFVNGLFVRWLRISPLIVTVGLLAIYRGLAYVVADGVSVFGLPSSFTAIGTARLLGIPIPVAVAGLVFLVGALLLQRTVGGLRLYAIGGNASSARLVGINVGRSSTVAYALNGLCIGVVALLATARLGSGSPSVGGQFELDVLTAVILGGVAFTGGSGHPLGVGVGVLTIGVVNSGLIFAGLQDWYQQIAKGSLLLLALLSDQLLLQWRLRRDGRSNPNGPPIPSGEPVDRDPPLAAGPGRQACVVGPIVLEVRGLSVRYGNVEALACADLEVRAGEVVCLVGDNGAGKSTLIKAISGVVRPASGALRVAGDQVRFCHPSDARAAGIETVHQDLALFENLGVAHNLVLGTEPRRRVLRLLMLRDDAAAVAVARDRLDSFGAPIADLTRPVSQLSGGQRQAVALGRVLRGDVRVVILDEPTAALGAAQTAHLRQLVRKVASAGCGVILISHDLEDIVAVADRVVMLRLGRVVHDGPVAGLDRMDLLRLMAGMATSDIG